LEQPVTEAAAGPAAPAETPAEPAVQGSERIEEYGEDVGAVPAAEAAPAEPDHKGLLHELAGIIRDIPLNALEVGHVSELKSWLVSHGL
jgi:hypothetical protein